MNLMEDKMMLAYLEAAFAGHQVSLFPESLAQTATGDTLAMASIDGEDKLICGYAPKTSGLRGVFHGKLLVCELNHANRLVLNQLLPYTAPSALGRDIVSIGLGDRLGIAGSALISAIADTGALPVLSQQSMREMQLTGRSFDDVLDAASWSVFRSGWRNGWGADGDHLKTVEDIACAVSAGCTMITLDCSGIVGDPSRFVEETVEDCFLRYSNDKDRWLLGLPIDEELVASVKRDFDQVINLAYRVWVEVLLPSGRPIDFEISLDEMKDTTSYFAHYFVAKELETLGVTINSLAPKFLGEFHKGIDYKGDLQVFTADFAMHQRIAAHFGYKISVHSGSDKFSVFPIVGALSSGRFHLKTSGTNWLSAVKVLAEKEPALFRQMLDTSIAHFDEARQYYEVHASLERIPDIGMLSDESLPSLLEKEDSRQLIHITYGFLIGQTAPLRMEIFAALVKHRQSVEISIKKHIEQHIMALGISKNGFLPRLCLTLTPKIIGSAPFLYEGDFCRGIHEAKGYGYNCVEIHVADPGEIHLENLAETLRETGMAVSALGTGRAYVNDGLSLIDDNPQVRDDALERLLRFIEVAEKLQCIVIVGCMRGNIPNMANRQSYIDLLAQAMSVADSHAAKRNVTIVFEPINRYENNFLCNAGEIVAFIKESNLVSTKLLLDTFHMNIEESDPVHTIEQYAPYIAHFHAADSNRRVPGEGHANFPAMLAMLSKVGYKGDISAECLPLPTKEWAARNWIQGVRNLLKAIPIHQ